MPLFIFSFSLSPLGLSSLVLLSSNSLWLPHTSSTLKPFFDSFFPFFSLSWSSRRHNGVGKWCSWVLVWIGVCSCGLWLTTYCGLAVVCWVLVWIGVCVWVICSSAEEVWLLVWIGCELAVEVCDFDLDRLWASNGGLWFWFGSTVGWWRFMDFGLDRWGGFALVWAKVLWPCYGLSKGFLFVMKMPRLRAIGEENGFSDGVSNVCEIEKMFWVFV